ncbi:MAG: hypothetical protein LBT98_00725 [Puniceicoccales bacterium]|nr:hypothetical protein [Puniceicoccales bacterium]
MEVSTYGGLAKCPIHDFSKLKGVSTGKKVFFVVTKILELTAIPLLVLAGVAWAPIGLPLILFFALTRKYESKSFLYRLTFKICDLPIRIMMRMWHWTLGKDIIISHVRIRQIGGLAVTALPTVALVVTVTLFFTTALIPLVVLWPVAAVLGCAAIFGLAVFGLHCYLTQFTGNKRKADCSTSNNFVFPWEPNANPIVPCPKFEDPVPEKRKFDPHDFLPKSIVYDGNFARY